MYCLSGHPMGAGQQFCTLCGAPAAAPPRAVSNTGVWVVLGTVVVAAAAVAIVFMLTNNGDGGGGGTTVAQSTAPATSQVPVTVSPPVTTALAPTAPVAPTDSVAPQVGTWREVPQFESASQSEITDAIIGDDRIVAVGSADGAPAIWESGDGTGWTRLAAPAAPPGQNGLEAIASIDGVFLAAGYDPKAAIWWSTDLSVWNRAATPAANPATTRDEISGVLRSQGQLIAYGVAFAGELA